MTLLKKREQSYVLFNFSGLEDGLMYRIFSAGLQVQVASNLLGA